MPPDTPIHISAISLGEMWAANQTTPTTNQHQRDQEERFVSSQFRGRTVLSIHGRTKIYFSDLIREIYALRPPPAGGKRLQQHLSAIGVDLHDVWIAAQALERNLVLVTNDRMEVIRKAADAIAPRLLDVEDWSL